MLFKRKNRDIELFDHPVVNEFEKNVANSLGVTIYSEDKTIIGKLVKKEIEQSKVPSDKLLKYFIENREQLKIFTIRAYSGETKIDDGEELSNKEIPKTLKTYGPGIGFGITYGIYFHFLFNNLKDELSDHLKARRIPVRLQISWTRRVWQPNP